MVCITEMILYTARMGQQLTGHEFVAALMMEGIRHAATASLHQNLTAQKQANLEGAARRRRRRTISGSCDHDQIASSQIGRKLREYFIALKSAQTLYHMHGRPQDWLAEILSAGLAP